MRFEKRSHNVIFLQELTGQLLWLETKMDENRLTVLSGGTQPLADESDADETEAASSPADRFGKALKVIASRLTRGLFVRQETVFIAPSHRLTARFLDTPPTDEENIPDLVAFEVSEALHVPIEEIAWDMLISSEHGPEQEKHLLWVAARKEFTDRIFETWPDGLLIPSKVTPDIWAVYEYLLNRKRDLLDDPAVIVSLEGGDRATITIANRKAIYVTRSIALDRHTPSGTDNGGFAQRERVLSIELERTLSYATDRFPQGSIRNMILIGFEDWPLDHINRTAEHNGLQVSHLTLRDVSPGFTILDADLKPDHLPMLCMAYCRLKRNLPGLNLIELEKEAVSWQSMVPEAAIPSKKFMKMAGSLAGAFLLLLICKWGWFGYAVDKRITKGKSMIELAEQLKKEESGLLQLSRTNIDYAGLFLYLAETLPKDTIVKNISLDSKTGVEFSLVGGNNQKVLEILAKLNSSDFFRDVGTERAVVEKDGFVVYLKGKLKTGS